MRRSVRSIRRTLASSPLSSPTLPLTALTVTSSRYGVAPWQRTAACKMQGVCTTSYLDHVREETNRGEPFHARGSRLVEFEAVRVLARITRVVTPPVKFKGCTAHAS